MKIKCAKCHGTKKIMVLGGLKKECPNCKGAGWLDEEIIKDPAVESEKHEEIKNAVKKVVTQRKTKRKNK